MLRYICSLPNHGVTGAPRELFYTDDEAGHTKADAFIQREDKQPGRGVYYCIGKLRDGAMSRCKDEVGELDHLVVDLDLKNIAEARDEVLRTLQELVLPPSEIRDSGFGLHAIWNLKEPVADEAGMAQAEASTKQLVELLAGDQAPTHRAALMRIPGSHNMKDGTPRRCRTIWESNTRCDISEFDEVFDLYGDRPKLTRKESPKSNGHSPEDFKDFRTVDGRLDVDALLAAMPPTGVGVNDVQPRALLALLQQGIHPGDIVGKVVTATMAMAESHKLGWDQEEEVRCVHARINTSLRRLHDEYDPTTGAIPSWLAGEFHEAWVAALATGKRPQLTRNQAGWYVRAWTLGGAEEHPAAGNTTEEKPGDRKTRASGSKDNPTSGRPGRQKIRATPFNKDFDETKLKVRAHLYAKHYQRGQATATIGCDGAGKSTVGIGEAVVLTTARNLLGEQPTERCRVWLYNADDDSEEMYRRVAAFCRHHGVTITELAGWLFIDGKDSFTVRVAGGNGNLTIDTASIAQITETIVENQIDVVIFDPLVAMHGVAENDNVRMSEVIHIFGDIAAKCDCAIDLCHHTRKPSAGIEEKEFNSDDSRGASAVRAAVRASRVFNRMSKAEAEKAGLSEEDRVFYIRIDRGKANYLPPATKATWFHLQSVELLNGEQVGTIAPWEFPGQDGAPSAARAAANDTAEHIFLGLLARLTLEGRTVSERPGVNYAPRLFAQEPEAKKAKVSKAALEAAMLRLFAAKRIQVDDTVTRGRRVHRLIAA